MHSRQTNTTSSVADWHQLSVEETLVRLRTHAQGLSANEAAARVRTYGSNQLRARASDPWWAVLLRQFTGPLIIVLLVAGLVSFLLHELVDAVVIAAAVAINSLIGFAQEYKANRTLEELRSLVQPTAIVLRDGKELSVSARALVPGDIVLLRAGDRVSADARLIEAADLSINESALTGESLPVAKQVARMQDAPTLAARRNMVYAGTGVVGGRALAAVVGIGMNTELGRIARLVEETRETRTPLQEQLGRMARVLAVLILVLVATLFFIGLASGRTLFEMFEMSVALAVAAIPEGLVLSVTVILAIGMQRILHRKGLVRRLVAAETLGSVSVICSDKTGTITQGEMRVTHLFTASQQWRHPFVLGEKPGAAMRRMLEIIALNNDAVQPADDPASVQGSPTERALLQSVVELGLDVKTLAFKLPRAWQIPFDSAHKYMVTAHTTDRHTDVFLKGAPDIVLPMCSKILSDGRAVAMSHADRAKWQERITSLSKQGIRVLAVATRSLADAAAPALEREELGGFAFVGLVGLRDPLRAEVREQIARAREAGIRTVMVTGDHPATASAIATEAGLTVDAGSVTVGSELDAWSEEELRRRVARVSVFARVEPRHKIRIVNAWQARGEIVAMTGDGVNDAPALKAADVGVAVGSGTEVAKQASDLVILDNNLGTITAAIEEGRVMFDNVRRTTVYLLSGSFTELILIGGALLLGWPLPLLAVQVLWINLVNDAFPAIGLTLEPAERDIMRRPPRSRREPILNAGMLRLTVAIAVVTNIVLFALFFWLRSVTQDIALIQTIMFAAVGLDVLIYVFAVKSFHRTLLRLNPFSNLRLLFGVAAGFALMMLALFHPLLQEMLGVVPLRLSDILLLLMMGMLKLALIELSKKLFVFPYDSFNLSAIRR